MGMLSDFSDDKERGMIPRALSQILEFATTTKRDADSSRMVITLSFLQIYLETIQDLLALSGPTSCGTRPQPWKRNHDRQSVNRPNRDLPVRQGRDGAFYVTGLSEYEIASIDDAHALLELAMRNRVLAATTKNKTSSRSHTLLTISIKRRTGRRESTSYDEDEEREEHDFDNESNGASTISFVDLAGSERVDGALHFLRATRARQEQRIREAKFINRSLNALGGVIAALAQPKSGTGSASAKVLARLNSGLRDDRPQSPGHEQGQPHIRFRDSQLTKLLQGRLIGGRGRLLLIATVDDQPKNLSETLSTLKFAAQCRRVELQPGSRLRGDRTTRNLRRQNSLLDQVFNDMKLIHENREAELHTQYQAQVQTLERELEAVRAAAQSASLLSTGTYEMPIHLASYSALCSLVDTICSIGIDDIKHPCVADFHSDKEMLDYVAGLYSRLKEALVACRKQDRGQLLPSSPATPVDSLELPGAESNAMQQAALQVYKDGESQKVAPPIDADKIAVPREPALADTIASKPMRALQMSAEREVEFRAIARHLIASHALDSIVVSSSDEEEDTTMLS